MNNVPGYSGKALVEKLGYKPRENVQLYNAPEWFAAHLQDCAMFTAPSNQPDWMHGFFTSSEQIANFLQFVHEAGQGFWVSWPKKGSGVETDLTEQTFRDIILPLGWVDAKVCAIDEIWSGLKFLRRQSPG